MADPYGAPLERHGSATINPGDQTMFKCGHVLAVGLACALPALNVAHAAEAEMYFSEYIEGSSNNKALEIYNPSGSAVDLASSGYTIEIFFNGSSTAGASISLLGTIAANGVFVLADDDADAAILAVADQTVGANLFNGDDAISLLKNGSVIDSFGQQGQDPGSAWGSGDTATQNRTLRRKTTVTSGDTTVDDPFEPSDEWDGFAQDSFDDLGNYASTAAELYFSEYIEGSSNNKALEIFNPGPAAVDLTEYVVQTFHNGNADLLNPTAEFDLSGSIAAGDVFVLAHSSADAAILAEADLASGAFTVNGDDAIVLFKAGAAIDAFGRVGEDPGSAWSNNGVSTANATLRRLATVSSGDPLFDDAFDPSLQWAAHAQDTFDGLGNHGSDSGDGEEPIDAGACGDPATLISTIQGDAGASPEVGNTHIIEAVVVGVYPNLQGFFVQEEDTDIDTDPNTSEGLFIYQGAVPSVARDDVVRISGQVAEHYDLTELTNISLVDTCGSATVSPASLSLPLASADALEPFEGMLVSFSQELSVTENYDLGRYGSVQLSSSGRLFQPTHVAEPGAAAQAIMAANALNVILLDDANSAQNPDPVIHPAPGLSASNTLRSGDTLSGLLGVVDYSFSAYRIQPVGSPAFVQSNPRTTAPLRASGSNLRIASFNVLNYFNGDGAGGGFPTARGAHTAEEFQRQHDKIIAALAGLDADIVGLMEIENDGYGAASAIAELVAGLNLAATSCANYAFVDPGVAQIGSDEIAVGFIYCSDSVSLSGPAEILDASVDASFIDTKNRPALAQTFAENSSGAKLTIAVNHLKSKGSDCDALGDPDTGDGQGNCNQTRTDAAAALVNWLATDPTGSGNSDRLIIGDLNAYAKEDPITAITSNGYINLLLRDHGDAAYSYIFYGQAGYLDHALASTSFEPKVMWAGEWHINTDEPRVLDYNTEYKSAGQIVDFYAADAYRASDHDPVVVDVLLSTPAPTPSPTPVSTPSPTPSSTPIPTPTATPLPTPSPTPLPSPTATPSASPSATPVATPTPAATPAPTASATPSTTPSPVATATPRPSATPTPTPVVVTPTPSPQFTPSPSPSTSPAPTAQATPTPGPAPSTVDNSSGPLVDQQVSPGSQTIALARFQVQNAHDETLSFDRQSIQLASGALAFGNIARLQLILDGNGNDQVDVGELILAETTSLDSEGRANFVLNPAMTLAPNSLVRCILVLDFN
ncbi:endonuclease/exonuclease/phosphatase [Oceanococcus atlanticus]|uniref:Endonuclease/exonuclease/phosphatase n=1 Tax=Oceanococcus atlanticus TaxID=1317117 RepID=A0A1Y1SJ94_9GAMM|nr:ExeM/NucH family extracellular endonuclease [Oceanococcus atlanticus]ORE89351.1 endonuclease/exonuclease/phosphatase [Oceanococcus atlanticus]